MIQKFNKFSFLKENILSELKINKICQKYNIENYTINPDGSIDVDGNINLFSKNLDKLPLKFNRVSEYFSCSHNHLTSLEGSPKEVGGNFYCHNNNLTSLIGAPQEVGGYFGCSNNNLTNLAGAPQEVGGYFDCLNNPLPKEIYDNIKYIKNIIELQDLYSIWRRDGSFNKFHFDEMMIDIKGEI